MSSEGAAIALLAPNPLRPELTPIRLLLLSEGGGHAFDVVAQGGNRALQANAFVSPSGWMKLRFRSPL